MKSLVVIFLFACSIAANADTIRGAVQNNTTRKPAAGDEVQLKRIGQGMEDVGTTKTNAKGEFHFDVPPSQRPYVILVKHQDVTYTHVVRPGASGEIVVQVFNAAPNVKEINIAEHVMVLRTICSRSMSSLPSSMLRTRRARSADRIHLNSTFPKARSLRMPAHSPLEACR